MSVAKHRIAAGTILLGASLGLVAVGRTLVEDSPAVAQVRERLDGKWVATRVALSPTIEMTDANAAATTVEFAGRQVKFTGLIDAGAAEGVFNPDPKPTPAKVDFKLDAGWILGVYQVDGDRLTLAVNALMLPEQLGVPARGRPEGFRPGQGRYVYEFRKVAR